MLQLRRWWSNNSRKPGKADVFQQFQSAFAPAVRRLTRILSTPISVNALASVKFLPSQNLCAAKRHFFRHAIHATEIATVGNEIRK
jgi:hypothetical protein